MPTSDLIGGRRVRGCVRELPLTRLTAFADLFPPAGRGEDQRYDGKPRRLIALAFGVGMLVWSLGLFGPAAILPYFQSDAAGPSH